MRRNGQAEGTVRTDIDPVAVGNGVGALVLAVLMSVTQIGREASGVLTGRGRGVRGCADLARYPADRSGLDPAPGPFGPS